MQVCRIDTDWGAFTASVTPLGISRLCFPAAGDDDREGDVARIEAFRGARAEQAHRLERELRQYLAGKRRIFTVAPVLPEGPVFHIRVWRALCAVPYAQTVSYGELAARAGSPLAARAVGQACGANPVPILVPCHRVLAANSLGGFSSGLDWKIRLLELEAR